MGKGMREAAARTFPTGGEPEKARNTDVDLEVSEEKQGEKKISAHNGKDQVVGGIFKDDFDPVS